MIKRMRKSKKIVILSTVAILFVSLISPVFLTYKNAEAVGTASDSEKVKQAALAYFAYNNCIGRSIQLKDEVKKGDKLSEIFIYTSEVQVDVGDWLRSQYPGMTTCKDILNALFSGTIQSIDIMSGGILSDVYNASITTKELTCKYKIWNDTKTAEYNNGHEYSYPQGYWENVDIYSDDYDLKDHLREPIIKFKYDPNENKWVGGSKAEDDLNSYRVGWSDNASETCKNIIDSNYIIHVSDGYILANEDEAFSVKTSTITGVASSSSQSDVYTQKKPDANMYLKRNIKNNFMQGYFDDNGPVGDAAYLIYGRMVFNGDSRFPNGCKGISVKSQDLEKFSEKHGYWDSSLSYIVSTRPFIGGIPQSVKTKIGASSVDAEGQTPSELIVNPLGSDVACSDLISRVNGVSSVSSSEIKTLVEGYVNVLGVDDLPPDPEDQTVSPATMDDDACYQHAKSLGWIICPIINGMTDVVTSLYEYIEPLLAVNDSIVGQIGDESGNIYKSWVQFRDMANVVFVVFFMIVIFSQLTGYGIDNYGIKKLLPKLIVTAILINLSFFICAVAVDISNILGSALQGLFNSLSLVDSGGTSAAGSFVRATAAIVGWITAAGAAVTAAVYFGGWALIIPILLYLLTAAISLFFAWIMLGLRQAVVIILIVISPLAIVLMALPNTENLFKKYISAFKGVLVVFPVIGGLIGAGTFAGSLLLMNNSNFIMTIIAGLLCVVPYFFIPSLTRKSLDALGGLGARLGQIGRNAGAGASRWVGNREAVKNLNEDLGRRQSTARAQRWMSSRRGQAAAEAVRTGTATSRQANQYKRFSAMANATDTDRINARGAQVQYERLSSEDGFDAAMASISNKERETSISDQDTLFSDRGVYDDDSKFAAEVYNAIRNDDDIKLEALMRKAAKGSDNQRGALVSSMDRALRQGSVSEKIARAYGSHVTTNDPYKAKDRSAFEQGAALLRSINGGTYQNGGGASLTRSNFTANGFRNGKITADQIFKMDDNEFKAIRDSLGGMSTEDKNAVISAMMNARTIKEGDKNNKYDYVQDSTMKLINQIIGNNTINIPHPEPTAGPAPGRDERRDSADFDESGF